MYSKHAASVGASGKEDVFTGRSAHRLLDQQGLQKPYGALGETLPQSLAPAVLSPSFQRRGGLGGAGGVGGDNSMLAYTERANVANQRRYQYNFPQTQAQTHGLYGTSRFANANGINGVNGQGRKWATLPKLQYHKDSTVRDPTQRDEHGINEIKRPQSDFTIHQPLSRPNTPVRPASDSTSHDPLPSISPRIRMQNYKGYMGNTPRGPNILSLTEEEAANAYYEDDFETEDSGFDHELKDLRETPEESALRDLNQPNRNIEITPFPGIIELSSQPAVMHDPNRLKSLQYGSSLANNASWTKKGRASIKAPVARNSTGQNSFKTLPDYPLTNVSTDSRKLDSGANKKSSIPSRNSARYSKQASESATAQDPSVPSPSPVFNMDEVIVPAVDEEHIPEEISVIVQPAKNLFKHPPTNKDVSDSSNSLNLNRSVKPNAQSPKDSNKTKKPTPKPEKAHDSNSSLESPRKTESPRKSDKLKEPMLTSSKSETVKETSTSSPTRGTNANSSKTFVKTDSMDEFPDIAVTGSKVSSKPPSPTKDTKPKKASSTKTSPAPKTASPPKPAKPQPIRIPTASTKTVATESDAKGSTSKDSGSGTKGAKKTKSKKEELDEEEELRGASKTKGDTPKKGKKTKKEEEEEEDLVPELRGVLKGKGDAAKKGKKKSVQFGPKFVREVTKITYPWNERTNEDSDSEEEESDEDDLDESDIEELIDEETETLISMENSNRVER